MSEGKVDFYKYVVRRVSNYGLSKCCWLLPLRVGLLLLGYFNVLASTVLTIGIVAEGFKTMYSKVQFALTDGTVYNSVCVLVPAVELAFSVVLLCGTHRDDVELLKFYMYYGIVAIVCSVLAYMLVAPLLDAFVLFSIVAGIVYQVYILILVWSVMVQIRKNKRALAQAKTVPAAAEKPTRPPDEEAPLLPPVTAAPTDVAPDTPQASDVPDASIEVAVDTTNTEQSTRDERPARTTQRGRNH